MILFQNLFMTDYGLLSLGVILGVIVIGWWMARWLGRKMDEDAGQGS